MARADASPIRELQQDTLRLVKLVATGASASIPASVTCPQKIKAELNHSRVNVFGGCIRINAYRQIV